MSATHTLALLSRPSNAFAIVVLAALCVLWSLVPALTTGTLPRDTLEALYWGLGWSWTTPKHPPLAPFLAEMVFRVSGGSPAAVYALGSLMTTAALLGLIWLGRETLGYQAGRDQASAGAAMALLSSGVLLLLPLSHEFNPNVAVLPFWVLVSILAWRAARDDRLIDWAALGLAAGLGFLAKYSILLALGASAIGLLATPTGRRRALRPGGPVLAAMTMALVTAPHLIAAAKADFVTFEVAARDVVWEPERRFSLVTLLDVGEFMGVLVLAAALPALAAFLFLRGAAAGGPNQTETGEGRIYVIVTALATLGLTLVAGILGARMRAPWGMPLGLMLGPLLVALHPRLSALAGAFRPDAARGVLASALLLPLFAFALYFLFAPQIAQRNPLREHLDGREVARLAETYWRRFGEGRAPLVLGLASGALERQAIGSISAFMRGRPPAYQYFWVTRYANLPDPALERFILDRDWPWIDMADVRARGGIAVAVGDEPPMWRRLGQCLDNLESMPLPVVRNGYRTQRLWFARIVPGDADAGPCPPPPEDYRMAAGLEAAPRTMDRLNRQRQREP